MQKTSYYIINGITIYRLVASFILLFLILIGNVSLFKWFLALSFFTDSIDGYLARKYKVSSIMGAKLDSIADDGTVLMGVIGAYVFKFDFMKEVTPLLLILFAFFLLQIITAFIKYGKPSSFHTYLAKASAIFQGSFLILLFFLNNPPYFLFYLAFTCTLLDLVEEIILVRMLPEWKTNVRGIYWVWKQRHNH